MKTAAIILACLAIVPQPALAAQPPSATEWERIEMHRTIAERRIHQHQAMTAAHVAGRTPVCPEADMLGADPVFFTPAFGESPLHPESDGADHVSLNELRMYWQQIPDFGIKRYAIYPSETGWAQVLYWSGTTRDGHYVHAEEADVFWTDQKFRIIRIENHHDWQQWKSLAALANGADPATFDKSAYSAAIMRQAKSPHEACRPARATK